MIKRRQVIATLTLIGLSSRAEIVPEVTPQALEGGFKIMIPRGFRVESVSPVEDFVLYTIFTAEGVKLLTVYLGNHPSGRQPAPVGTRFDSTSVNGFAIEFASWAVPRGFDGEARIKLGGEWPNFAGFYFNNITSSQSIQVKNIIFSFSRVNKIR